MSKISLWGDEEVSLLPEDTCEQHDERRILQITEQVGDFQRFLSFFGAHNCSQPRSDGGNHGIGSMQVRFILAGPKGAVVWLINTGWYPRSVDPVPAILLEDKKPEAWDLGFHRLTPRYEGQTPIVACPYLQGQPCYYDGTSLNAVRFTPDFLTHPRAIWDALEEAYWIEFEAKH